MAELGLPDFPKKSALDRKIAAYEAKARDHRAGKHGARVKGCKACNEPQDREDF